MNNCKFAILYLHLDLGLSKIGNFMERPSKGGDIDFTQEVFLCVRVKYLRLSNISIYCLSKPGHPLERTIPGRLLFYWYEMHVLRQI